MSNGRTPNPSHSGSLSRIGSGLARWIAVALLLLAFVACAHGERFMLRSEPAGAMALIGTEQECIELPAVVSMKSEWLPDAGESYDLPVTVRWPERESRGHIVIRNLGMKGGYKCLVCAAHTMAEPGWDVRYDAARGLVVVEVR